MVVYLLEDHELPLITVNAMLGTGSWLDPADKVGLAAHDRRRHANRRFGSACPRSRSMRNSNT